MTRPWYRHPDPLLVMFVLVAAAGLLLGATGERLGLRDSFRGTPVNTVETPGLRLTDQNGAPRSLQEFEGRAVVLTFLYSTCPDACPAIAERLKVVDQKVGDNRGGVVYVAVSVDPAHDTVAAVKSFSEEHGMPDNWYFLTGSPAEVAPVLAAYQVGTTLAQPVADAADVHSGHGAETAGAGPEELAHSAPVYLIDTGGFQRFIYPASFSADDLAHDIQFLTGPLAQKTFITFADGAGGGMADGQ